MFPALGREVLYFFQSPLSLAVSYQFGDHDLGLAHVF